MNNVRYRRIIIWATLALVGLASSAAIALAASRISNQHVGLSSQPHATATASLAQESDSPKVAPDGGSTIPSQKVATPDD